MARNLGINIKIGADLKQFSTDMQNAQRQMRRTSRKFKQMGSSMTRSLTLPLGLMGGAMIKFASDTQESLNKVDVAFGDSSKEVQEFSKTTLKSFGIARGSALDMAATFGDMGTSMGLSQDRAAEMSMQLVGLAGDLASFKNIRIDVAQTALTSIFTGETESLKKLGIVMTQANLSAFALEQGITKPLKAMSEGEKTMLRYQFVMAKTSNAHGDFERTGGGAANQMRIFQEGLKELGDTFGQIVLPMFTSVVQKANQVVQWFGTLSESTKKVILAVGGLVAVLGPVVYGFGSLIKLVYGSVASIKAFATVAAVAVSPLGILAGVLALVGLRMKTLNDRKKRYAEISRQNYGYINAEVELRRKSFQLAHAETYQVNALLEVARDETKTKTERLNAINKLNSINPQYINGITLENVETAQTTEKVKDYIKHLKQKAKVQAASELLQAEYNKQIQVEIDIAKKREEQIANEAKRRKELDAMKEGVNMQGELSPEAIQKEEAAIKRTNNEYEKQIQKLERKSKAISENIKVLVEAGGVEEIVTSSTIDDNTLDETNNKLKETSKNVYDLGLMYNGLSHSWDPDAFVEGLRKVKEESSNTFDVVNEKITEFEYNMMRAAESLKNGLASLAGDTLGSFFEEVGKKLSKQEDAFDNFGQEVLLNVANFMGNFGKLLVAGAIASEAMQKALFSNPILALGAGVALIATAGLIKGMTKQNPVDPSGSAPSYTGSSIGGGGTFGYGNTSDVLTLETVVYGRDIVLSSNRQHGTISRTRRK